MYSRTCETAFGICSGHGTCVNNTCICDPGWNGHGDLLDRTGYDCNVNRDMTTAFYSFQVALNAIGVCLALYRVRNIKFWPKMEFQKQLKNSPILLPLFLLYVAEILSFIFSLTLAISDQRVGYEIFITIIYLLIWSVIIPASGYGCPILIDLFISMFRFLKRGQLPIIRQSQEKYAQVIEKWIQLHNFVFILLLWVYAIGLGFENPDIKVILVIYLWNIYTIYCLSFFMVVFSPVFLVLRVLTQHSSSDSADNSERIRKSKIFLGTCAIGLLSPGLGAVLLAWYEPIRNQSAVIFPIVDTFVCISLTLFIWYFRSEANEETGSDSGKNPHNDVKEISITSESIPMTPPKPARLTTQPSATSLLAETEHLPPASSSFRLDNTNADSSPVSNSHSLESSQYNDKKPAIFNPFLINSDSIPVIEDHA